jgi:uncharacterized small protein (TIGR04563 family)
MSLATNTIALARSAEHVEEGVEAGGGAVAGDVKQTASAVVDLVNEREVLVAFFPGEFVDADSANAVEAAMLQAPSHGVLDAAEDRVPARPKAARDLFPRQDASPTGHEPHERMRRLHLARRPRHRLDGDATARAIDPPHGVSEDHGEAPERHEREQARRQLVVTRPLLEARRAQRTRPLARAHVQRHRRVQVTPGPSGFGIDETGLRLEPAQDRFELHRVGCCWCRNPTSRTMHPSLPVTSTGARRAARGRDAHSIPRCELRDERRTPRSLAFTPTNHAEEPYFPAEVLEEIAAEARRLDRSMSWVVQRAWKLARRVIAESKTSE